MLARSNSSVVAQPITVRTSSGSGGSPSQPGGPILSSRSISVSQVSAWALSGLGMGWPLALTDWANSRVRSVASSDTDGRRSDVVFLGSVGFGWVGLGTVDSEPTPFGFRSDSVGTADASGSDSSHQSQPSARTPLATCHRSWLAFRPDSRRATSRSV